MTKIQRLLLTGLGLWGMHAQAQSLCVYDPMGAQGDSYAFMKDYALAAKQWGAEISLQPYPDDQRASDDFKSGKCDALATTGIRARQFNNFSGSIDSAGAVPDEATAKIIISWMANPRLAAELQRPNAEIVGVSLLGPAYPMINDRSINTMGKLSGKRFGVLDYDKAQQAVVAKIGATPIVVNLSSIGSKFNSAQIDVIDLPAVAFKALELHKGMGNKGAIVRYPVAYITTQIVIHPAKFPDYYGQKSRYWVADQLDRQVDTVRRIESSIEARYWMDIPPLDKLNYDKFMRDARISLESEGAYDKRMGSLLKKIRCVQNPSSYECGLRDE